MTKVDRIEMVCDWTALSQGFGQDGGGARGWAEKTIDHRVKFNEVNTRFIAEVITQLDQWNAVSTNYGQPHSSKG